MLRRSWCEQGRLSYPVLSYSKELLREKTFAIVTVLGSFTKVFFANIACAHNLYLVYGTNV